MNELEIVGIFALNLPFLNPFSQSEVRELWARLQRGKPELLVNFEHFLVKVSSHIQEIHQEKETIEQALKR